MIIRKISVFITLLLICVFFIQQLVFATATLLFSDMQDAAEVNEIVTEIGGNFVCYPQLDGMQNTELQQQINDAIVNEAQIAQRLITLTTMQQNGIGLQVTCTTYCKDQLFSTVISAKGMMENFRSGHQYTTLSYDLLSGARLQLKDFLADPAAAVAWMESQLQKGYTDELSNYLEYAELTPLPVNSFSFDENGITFYYPYQQFALLSEYSGAVQFQYGELQDFLIAEDDSVPSRLGALIPQYSNAQIKENIEAVITQGMLPYLPIQLGDLLPDVISLYRLIRTPDQYPGGRYFQMEAPAFRQVLVMSDALTQSWDHSVVEGILAMRMNLYGIQTGVTSRNRWHQILGIPKPSVVLDAFISADYGLPAGTADYYSVADRQLMLYADENDILYAVRLAK